MPSFVQSEFNVIGRKRFSLGIVLLALLACTARAASPRDQLLRMVPEDIGFCVAVEDLRGASAHMAGSPFWKALLASPLGVQLAKSPELRKLHAVDRQFQQALQVDWARLQDDLFGDALVFAYRPGPSGKQDQEQGLFLLYARDAKLLANLFDRLNQLQQTSGEVKAIESRSHSGVSYFCRVEVHGQRFYYLHDGILAVSSEESFLCQAIDRDRQPVGTEVTPVARQFTRMGLDGKLVQLWLNPRAFDVELRRAASQATGPETMPRKMVLDFWLGLDGIALSVSPVKQALEVDLHVAANAALERALAEGPRPSVLWSQFPAHALFATGGCFDAGGQIDPFMQMLPLKARAELKEALDRTVGAALGKDMLAEILPNLGPSWGLCITAPESGSKAWVPEIIALLEVKPGEKGAEIARALLTGVTGAAMLAVVNYNSNHPDRIALRKLNENGVDIQYLDLGQAGPVGVQPAFAFKDGFLVLASSPALVQRFKAGRGAAPSESKVPLFRVSLRELARYLNERQNSLAAALASQHQLTPEEFAKRLTRLRQVVALFDRVELQRYDLPGLATWTLRVSTVEPLR